MENSEGTCKSVYTGKERDEVVNNLCQKITCNV